MKIITLNIQGGFKIDQVCQEVKEKLAPFDILCLQEVCESREIKNHAQQIAESLGKNYASESFLPIDFKVKNMGNAFVFNQKTLKLLDASGFTLPSPLRNFLWKSLDNRFKLSCDRLCLTGLFQVKKGLKIRIANLHLDFVGGPPSRKRQIQFTLKTLSDLEKAPLEFVLGDFNTLHLFKRSSSELNLLLEKGFEHISKNVSWTASPSNPDPAWEQTYWLMQLVKPFRFLLKQKMDHIFVKGHFVKTQCSALSLHSTDHRAVILNFSP